MLEDRLKRFRKVMQPIYLWKKTVYASLGPRIISHCIVIAHHSTLQMTGGTFHNSYLTPVPTNHRKPHCSFCIPLRNHVSPSASTNKTPTTPFMALKTPFFFTNESKHSPTFPKLPLSSTVFQAGGKEARAET